jgi:hypothetical protein
MTEGLKWSKREAPAEVPSAKIRNPNIEVRNKDRMTEGAITKTRLCFGNFPLSVIRICFEIRASNFELSGRLLHSAVVDFNYADARAVIYSREESGVRARRKRRCYPRLEVVGRRQARSS